MYESVICFVCVVVCLCLCVCFCVCVCVCLGLQVLMGRVFLALNLDYTSMGIYEWVYNNKFNEKVELESSIHDRQCIITHNSFIFKH